MLHLHLIFVSESLFRAKTIKPNLDTDKAESFVRVGRKATDAAGEDPEVPSFAIIDWLGNLGAEVNRRFGFLAA